MIKIRYRDPNELSPGLHAAAERHGRTTTVFLLSGLSEAQRRAALRRLKISARRGYGPRLPAPQLALALLADRIRTSLGRGGAVFRSHPAGSTVPVMVVSGGAIAFLALSAVSIQVIHSPRVPAQALSGPGGAAATVSMGAGSSARPIAAGRGNQPDQAGSTGQLPGQPGSGNQGGNPGGGQAGSGGSGGNAANPGGGGSTSGTQGSNGGTTLTGGAAPTPTPGADPTTAPASSSSTAAAPDASATTSKPPRPRPPARAACASTWARSACAYEAFMLTG